MDDFKKKKKRLLVNKNFIAQPRVILHLGQNQVSCHLYSTGPQGKALSLSLLSLLNLFLIVGTKEYWHRISSMLHQGEATDFPLKSNSSQGFALIYDGIKMHLKIKTQCLCSSGSVSRMNLLFIILGFITYLGSFSYQRRKIKDSNRTVVSGVRIKGLQEVGEFTWSKKVF